MRPINSLLVGWPKGGGRERGTTSERIDSREREHPRAIAFYLPRIQRILFSSIKDNLRVLTP